MAISTFVLEIGFLHFLSLSSPTRWGFMARAFPLNSTTYLTSNNRKPDQYAPLCEMYDQRTKRRWSLCGGFVVKWDGIPLIEEVHQSEKVNVVGAVVMKVDVRCTKRMELAWSAEVGAGMSRWRTYVERWFRLFYLRCAARGHVFLLFS